MNCYIHPATPATATCQSCGRGLCSPCSARFTLLRCQHCIIEGDKAVAQKTRTALAVTAIIFLAVFFLVGNLTTPHSQGPELRMRAVVALYVSFTYWGYKFLSAHMPRLFIASPMVWFFYFMLKFVLACLFGFLLGPFQLYKSVRP